MVKYGNWELAVSDVKGKIERGEVVPDPDWQRGYIWKLKDEQLLIDSIMNEMPIPKFYLTEEYDKKKNAAVHYAVDGQQRLRAIHRFLSNKFPVELNDTEYYFKDLDSTTQETITTYKLDGHYMRDFTQADINFLFQRLNRTGIKLTNMEEWNNEFTKTNILQLVNDIRGEHKGFYEDVVYTDENVSRMLPLDDIIDLCHCLFRGGVQAGRKKDLSDLLKNEKDISSSQQKKLKVVFRKVIRNLREIISKQDLEASQYRKRTHFVSLFLAVGLLASDHYLLTKPRQLKSALLTFIDNQPPGYKESVLGAIRDKVKRAQRVDNLQTLIRKYSLKLDTNRSFPDALRQKLWHQSHQCQLCKKPMAAYGSCVVDHIEPWAKGGKTTENNAQLAHRKCNGRKRDKSNEFIVVPY